MKYRVSRIGYKIRNDFTAIRYTLYAIRASSGFTLLETMIAVTLLAVAIVAPMSLTAQSLASAYYARDQITAFYLAQEGIETIRNVRDNNVLKNSQGTAVNLFNTGDIPSFADQQFTVDARNNQMQLCTAYGGGVCPPLQTDATNPQQGLLFGYGLGTNTQFTRKVSACFVQSNGTCTGTATDEVKITAVVTWQTGGLQLRTVRVSQNLYRWVQDGSAAQ